MKRLVITTLLIFSLVSSVDADSIFQEIEGSSRSKDSDAMEEKAKKAREKNDKEYEELTQWFLEQKNNGNQDEGGNKLLYTVELGDFERADRRIKEICGNFFMKQPTMGEVQIYQYYITEWRKNIQDFNINCFNGSGSYANGTTSFMFQNGKAIKINAMSPSGFRYETVRDTFNFLVRISDSQGSYVQVVLDSSPDNSRIYDLKLPTSAQTGQTLLNIQGVAITNNETIKIFNEVYKTLKPQPRIFDYVEGLMINGNTRDEVLRMYEKLMEQDKNQKPEDVYSEAKKEFKAKGGRPALKDNKEKVSYSLGIDTGNSLKKQSIDVDHDMFAKGLKDAYTGADKLMTDQEVREIWADFQKAIKAKQQDHLQDYKGKAGYIMGLSAGNSLKKQSVHVDHDMFANGLKDSYSGADKLMTDQEVHETLVSLAKEIKERGAKK